MVRNRTTTLSLGGLTMVALVAALLGTVALPRRASADAITEANVAQMAAMAKTAADHQALADYFTAQAVAAGEQVKTHQAWLAEIQKPGSVGGKGAIAFTNHCQSLIASYKKSQQAYEAMAADQAKMAKSAK